MNKNIISLENKGNKIEIICRKSSKAKRVIIRISQDKIVQLIVPKRVSFKNAINFLHSKSDWIYEKFSVISNKQQPELQKFGDNSSISIFGNNYTIIYGNSLRGNIKIQEDKIIIYGEKEKIHNKILQYINKIAANYIKNKIQDYNKMGEFKYKRITVRDTKTRWGSCSSKGNLSFSWRLALAPREVFDYVIAHELAHLKEMNHSKNFWHIVSILYPDYKKARKWLKTNGSNLHLY